VWKAFHPLKSHNPVTKAITATAWLRNALPGRKPRFEKLPKLLQSLGSHQQARHYIFVPFFNITFVISNHACFILHPIFISDSGVARQSQCPKLCRGSKKLSEWVSEWHWSGRPSSASKIIVFRLIPCCTAFRIWHSLTLSINSPFLWILTPMSARSHDTDDTDRMGPFFFMGPCIVNIFKHNQQDATLHNGIYYRKCSTCFRRYLRPSSGAQNCIIASGICRAFSASYRYRELKLSFNSRYTCVTLHLVGYVWISY
jgi:hypothetical protein